VNPPTLELQGRPVWAHRPKLEAKQWTRPAVAVNHSRLYLLVTPSPLIAGWNVCWIGLVAPFSAVPCRGKWTIGCPPICSHRKRMPRVISVSEKDTSAGQPSETVPFLAVSKATLPRLAVAGRSTQAPQISARLCKGKKSKITACQILTDVLV
jgi:hypothetical protein